MLMVKRHMLLAHHDFPDLPAEVVAAADYDALAERASLAEQNERAMRRRLEEYIGYYEAAQARLAEEEASHAITAANLARLQARWDSRPVVDDLQARLTEAERDAARYRWIHDHVNYVHGTGFVLDLHSDADRACMFQWGVDAGMKFAAQQITHNFGADDDGMCDSCGQSAESAVHRHRTADSADEVQR